MKNFRKWIVIGMIIIIVLVIGFYFISKSITKYTGFTISEQNSNLKKGSDFESCLQEQDITLYVNMINIRSLKDIKLFDYLQYFKMINCFWDNKICLENEVNSFPTWIINKNRFEKDISLNELKEIIIC